MAAYLVETDGLEFDNDQLERRALQDGEGAF